MRFCGKFIEKKSVKAVISRTRRSSRKLTTRFISFIMARVDVCKPRSSAPVNVKISSTKYFKVKMLVYDNTILVNKTMNNLYYSIYQIWWLNYGSISPRFAKNRSNIKPMHCISIECKHILNISGQNTSLNNYLLLKRVVWLLVRVG